MKAASPVTGFLSAIAVIGAFSFVILYLPGAGDPSGQTLDAAQQSTTKLYQPEHVDSQKAGSGSVSG